MKYFRVPRAILAFSVIAGLFVTSFAGAETFPEVMFVLDASGSMWSQAGGETKIVAARNVLEKIVPSLPPEVKVGLTVYGHRLKGDCSDIEVLIAPGSDDRAGLMAYVQRINPKGMTPIADSIKLVSEALKGREGETTIVLVSDGEETCVGNPCEVVRGLKSSGTKFVLHVVGFDVNEKQKKQLVCLAEAGGGKYFGADNAKTLLSAFESVKKEVARKVEKAKTKKTQKKTKLGKLQIKIPKNGVISIDSLKILRKRDGKVVKTAKNPKADSVHILLSDEYQLIAGFANPNYRPPTDADFGTFQVKGGETTTAEFGVVSFNLADSLSRMPVASVILSDMKNGKPLINLINHDNDYYLFKSKPAPPGTYSYSIFYFNTPKPTVIAKDIEVSHGKEAVVTIDSGLRLKRPQAQAGEVKGWDLVAAGGKDPLISVTRRWDNEEPLWRNFAIPPGKYDLYLRIKGMDEPLQAGEGVTVSKGELLEFDTGM
jgi:hypothetical protein